MPKFPLKKMKPPHMGMEHDEHSHVEIKGLGGPSGEHKKKKKDYFEKSTFARAMNKKMK